MTDNDPTSSAALPAWRPEKPSRMALLGDSAGAFAAPAEIMRSIATLTGPELVRLRNFSRFRLRAFGGQHQGFGAEDLLAEAFMATLAEERRWQPANVDLVGHLCGVMRSISSHWAAKRVGRDVQLDEGQVTTSERTAAADNPESRLSARQELAAIRALFAEDPPVLALLDAFSTGLTGPEIKESFGWSQTEMETVARRLRRAVDKRERTDTRAQV